MTAFVAKLVVKPEKREEFERLQTELRILTHQNEPGTPVYELIRSRDNANVYLCVATFTDDAAFDFHMKTDFHDRIAPQVLACLAEEMDLGFYDIVGDPARAES
ncbi:MAG: antibiotic biosynthesis monooxygenase [Alphaproteobacteria bacterium]|nr:antibiotic biosynthesis monooxygenase [Alphaproteobacteria bacterium]